MKKISGYLPTPHQECSLIILEDKINNLENDIQSMTLICEELDARKFELEAQKKIEFSFMEKDVEDAREKSKILWQYITLLQSDDFKLNRIRNECDIHTQEIWSKLKPINGKAKIVKEQLVKLRELQEKCDRLRQEAAGKTGVIG